jgi:hypothetical protein
MAWCSAKAQGELYPYLNIKMDLTKIRYEDVDWIHVASNSEMNFWVL